MGNENASTQILELFNPYINKTTSEIPHIPKKLIESLIKESLKEYSNSSTLIFHDDIKCVIIGDIHGNIQDLTRIIRKFQGNDMIFLGDYVDRGSYSVEVICLLLALHCADPKRIILLRGNHEFSQINKAYGFYQEIKTKYKKKKIWKNFQHVFNFMPIGCVLKNQILCVHGGISNDFTSLKKLQKLHLPIKDFSKSSLVRNIVWSDPEYDLHGKKFAENSRGYGQLFSYIAVKEFLENNHLKLLVRAHQATDFGVGAFANFLGVTVYSTSEEGNIKCGVVHIINDKEIHFYSLSPDDGIDARPHARMLLSDEIGLLRYSPNS